MNNSNFITKEVYLSHEPRPITNKENALKVLHHIANKKHMTTPVRNKKNTQFVDNSSLRKMTLQKFIFFKSMMAALEMKSTRFPPGFPLILPQKRKAQEMKSTRFPPGFPPILPPQKAKR